MDEKLTKQFERVKTIFSTKQLTRNGICRIILQRERNCEIIFFVAFIVVSRCVKLLFMRQEKDGCQRVRSLIFITFYSLNYAYVFVLAQICFYIRIITTTIMSANSVKAPTTFPACVHVRAEDRESTLAAKRA